MVEQSLKIPLLILLAITSERILISPLSLKIPNLKNISLLNTCCLSVTIEKTNFSSRFRIKFMMLDGYT